MNSKGKSGFGMVALGCAAVALAILASVVVPGTGAPPSPVIPAADAGVEPDAEPAMDHSAHRAAMAANLKRSAIISPADMPLELPELASTNGVPMGEQLLGRWSLVFFGYTSCPNVCPVTLSSLSRAARLTGSGFHDKATQLLFVTVDPDTDTLDRVEGYLGGFHPDFLGYTGSAEALASLSEQIGAAFAASENNIDHSTSLFVIDPEGRPAGVLLRPTDPQRVIEDLGEVRQALARVDTALVATRDGEHAHH
jgi:protein SCO1/2